MEILINKQTPMLFVISLWLLSYHNTPVHSLRRDKELWALATSQSQEAEAGWSTFILIQPGVVGACAKTKQAEQPA